MLPPRLGSRKLELWSWWQSLFTCRGSGYENNTGWVISSSPPLALSFSPGGHFDTPASALFLAFLLLLFSFSSGSLLLPPPGGWLRGVGPLSSTSASLHNGADPTDGLGLGASSLPSPCCWVQGEWASRRGRQGGVWRRRRDGGEGWILGSVGLWRSLREETCRWCLWWWGWKYEVGGGGRRGGGAEWGVYVCSVVVRVCVSVRVGCWVRDGQREFATSTRSSCCMLRVVESLWSSGSDGGVRWQRRGCDEAHVVARVLGCAMLHSLMLLGKRGSAAARALTSGSGEPLWENVVLRSVLHVVAVMMMVGWWRCLLLLVVPRNTDSSSGIVAVTILGVQNLQLGWYPSRTSSPSNPSRVWLTEVGQWGGAWGRGGWVDDGRCGGGIVGGWWYHKGTHWTLRSRRCHHQGTRNLASAAAKEVSQPAASRADPTHHPSSSPSPSRAQGWGGGAPPLVVTEPRPTPHPCTGALSRAVWPVGCWRWRYHDRTVG